MTFSARNAHLGGFRLANERSPQRFCPCRGTGTAYFPPMSAAQIIDELAKLTPADLLAVRRKLIEISEENEGVALCDAAALEGAQLLDKLEAGDDAR